MGHHGSFLLTVKRLWDSYHIDRAKKDKLARTQFKYEPNDNTLAFVSEAKATCPFVEMLIIYEKKDTSLVPMFMLNLGTM